MLPYPLPTCVTTGTGTRFISADWGVKGNASNRTSNTNSTVTSGSNSDNSSNFGSPRSSTSTGGSDPRKMSWQSKSRSLMPDTNKDANADAKTKLPIREQMTRASRKFADFGDRMKKRFSPEFVAIAENGERIDKVASSDTPGDVYKESLDAAGSRGLERRTDADEENNKDGMRKKQLDQLENQLYGYQQYANELGPGGGTQAGGGQGTAEPWPGYLASRNDQWQRGALSPGQLSVSSFYSQEPKTPAEVPNNIRQETTKHGDLLQVPGQQNERSSDEQDGHNPKSGGIRRRRKEITPSEVIDDYIASWDPDARVGDDTQTLKAQGSSETISRGPWRLPENLDPHFNYQPLAFSRIKSPGIGMPGNHLSGNLAINNSQNASNGSLSWPLPPSSYAASVAHRSQQHEPYDRPPRMGSFPVQLKAQGKSKTASWGKKFEDILRKSPPPRPAPAPMSRFTPLTLTSPPSVPYAVSAKSSEGERRNAEMAARAGRQLLRRDSDGYWRPALTPCTVIKEARLRPRNYEQYGPDDGGWI